MEKFLEKFLFRSNIKVGFHSDDSSTSGIKASHLNVAMMLTSSICFVLLMFFMFLVNTKFRTLKTTTDKFAICQSSTSRLKEDSNYLSEQARLFVVTGDIQYLNNYFHEKNVVQERKHALEELENVFDENDVEFKRINTAFKQSENLISTEIYAMKLKYASMGYPVDTAPKEISETEIRQTDRTLSKEQLGQKALSDLFDGGYMLQKLRIDQNCRQLIEDITYSIRNDLTNSTSDFKSNLYIMMILQVLTFIAILAFILVNSYLVIRPIKNFLKSIVSGDKFQEKGTYELRLLAHTYNEIYTLKAAKEKRLKKNTEIDPLTGVLNRKAFESICLDFTLSETRTVLLIIDIDDFKLVNDIYGHAVADKVLQILAKELKSTFRASDYIARLGGDEFAVLLPDFKGVVEDILKAKISRVNENLCANEGLGELSISVGASVNEEGFSNDMFEKADKALFKTKKNGKKGVTVYVGE